MREILFRAKRIDNGEWVEGDFCRPSNICMETIGYDEVLKQDNVPIWNDYQVIPETVGQFTGLTDKNGKRIFEGDLVVGYARIFKSYVEWNQEQAGWSPFGDERTSFYEDESEVVGNIHEKLKTPDWAEEK